MAWSLYEKGEFLEPLKFSNGKTQQDVVEEVLKEIRSGEKVIFIHGQCGTGKSAIALNLAKELGKTSIVVPGKNLQQQYKKDYEGNKYLLKDKENSESKMKISVMTGRKNHKCKYLEDSKNILPRFTKEINSRLNDIFEGKREELSGVISNDLSADNQNIPCKIEIKEKNISKIRHYLKQNKKINIKNFEKISDVKRMSIAPVCPYWSPIIPEEYEVNLNHESKQVYKGLGNKNFVYYKRHPGCAFYEQFQAYIDSDVIVFNSLKYLLESALNRKPATNVEIIDECDEFLDSFSNQRNINFERLQNVLGNAIVSEEDSFNTISEIMEIIKQIKRDSRVNRAIQTQEIIPLKETGVFDLFRIFLRSSEFLNEIDEESYIFDVERSALMFEEFLDESYVTFSKKDESIIASVVTTNLAKKFKEMINKNKIIVLMSGTIHSEEVLRNIFGLDNFKIIEAETVQPGEIKIKRTGLEFDCKYSNFSNGNASREKYLKALDKCVEVAEKPILIHVNSFIDLPNEMEIEMYNLKNLITRDKMREMQNKDNEGILISDFKKGKIHTLFSTRCARGVDFPGEQCRSIIFTKYPNPNVKDAFWRILNKTQPQYYWEFYKDKAKRELLQKLYRGLRFNEDRVTLLSPDERVLEAFEETKNRDK
jgi:Rad3-related DNA helicase